MAYSLILLPSELFPLQAAQSHYIDFVAAHSRYTLYSFMSCFLVAAPILDRVSSRPLNDS